MVTSLNVIDTMKRINHKSHEYQKKLIKLISFAESNSPDNFPDKVLIDSSKLQEMSKISKSIFEYNLIMSDSLQKIEMQFEEFEKIRQVVSSFKKQLANMKERIKRDGKLINSNIKRISQVIKEFRERCRDSYVEYLKTIDLDLRRVMKPFISMELIDEFVDYPRINPNESLYAKFEKQVIPKRNLACDTNEELNANIQMLVNTMNSVVKDMLMILTEANKKYYEIVNPELLGSRVATPLAQELPEYFTFSCEDSPGDSQNSAFDKYTVFQLKNKIQYLKERGDITARTAEMLLVKLDKMVKEGRTDINEIFADTDIPITKREEIVFKLIQYDKADLNDVDISDVLEISPENKLDTVRFIEKGASKGQIQSSFDWRTTERPEDNYLDKTIDEKLEKINNTPADSGRVELLYFTPTAQASKGRLFKQRASVQFSIVRDTKDEGYSRPVTLNRLRSRRNNSEIRVRNSTPKVSKKHSPKKTASHAKRLSLVNKSML